MTIALGAGLSSAWMVNRYVAKHAGSGTAVPLTRVVVAAADIPVAASLTPELLKVVDWPTSAQPQGSFDRVEVLLGRVAGSSVIAGEAVVEARLSPKGAGAGMASLIPANMRAMTVPVNEVIGVSGFIHPGDLVDVITTMQGPAVQGTSAGLEERYRSKIVLQDIRVLAVGQQLSSDSNKPEAVPAVTLLVSPEESERLALASTQGKLQLTMRSQIDREQLQTPGVSPPELLGLGRVTPPPPPAPAALLPPPRPHAPPPAIAVAPRPAPTAPVEVVEVFHGDRVEQRKLSAKGVP
jgi:pilus assembly protein CpaB